MPFAVMVLLNWSHTPDDALITLRYAYNVVHGHGAVFNIGDRVQGFSSPLHLFLDVVTLALPGGYALLKAKLVSLAFGVSAAREGAMLVDSCTERTWIRRTAYLLIATSFILVISSVNGLETSLEALLVAALTRRLIDGSGTRVPLAAGVIAFVLVLTRPEAILLVATFAVTSLVVERRVSLGRRVAWAAGGAVAFFGTLVVSQLYFGDPLPNTYYAKAQPFLKALPHGVAYLLRLQLKSQARREGRLEPAGGIRASSDRGRARRVRGARFAMQANQRQLLYLLAAPFAADAVHLAIRRRLDGRRTLSGTRRHRHRDPRGARPFLCDHPTRPAWHTRCGVGSSSA